MSPEDKAFIQGFAAAIGTLARGFGQPNLAKMIADENGFGLKDFKEAECEDYYIEPIKEEFDR